MNTFMSPVIICTSLLLLAILTYIDLRDRLLPNIYVFPFAILGVLFHLSNNFYYVTSLDMLIGMLAGGGTLLLIRTAANAYYKKDTLGLGDVKLMAAAGLWLGIHHIFLALSVGAFLGVLHGLGYALYTKHKTLSNLTIPAGPGLIAGIILTGLIKFYWT